SHAAARVARRTPAGVGMAGIAGRAAKELLGRRLRRAGVGSAGVRAVENAGMTADDLEMLARLLAALAAGAFIGYERSYHGRPAGFRTHALVCTASSLLMLVTVYESHWMSAVAGRVQIDPTRMAQGIMTGIGFLGAGVIIKEGFSVRGLTTAASIWITAAIGILAGIGF